MSFGRSLSRDALTGKTNTAKARIIKNSTQNGLYKKHVPSGVAMSELSNGIKKHTSKSHETIPLMISPWKYFSPGASLSHFKYNTYKNNNKYFL
jgi:hypothetical protein